MAVGWSEGPLYDLKSEYDLGVVCMLLVNIYLSVNRIENFQRSLLAEQHSDCRCKTVQGKVQFLHARERTAQY